MSIMLYGETTFSVEWQNMVKSVDVFAFGLVQFGGATFTLEHQPEFKDYVLSFLMPCCLTRCLSPYRGGGYGEIQEAYCKKCSRKYSLHSGGDSLYYDLEDPEYTDKNQHEAMEVYFTHWGKNPFDATLLALDFAQAMQDFVVKLEPLPLLTTIPFAEYRTRWAPRHG